MQFFELATLTLRVGTLAPAGSAPLPILASIEAYAADPESGGELLGCWASEFGPQNKIVLLRTFKSKAGLDAERQRLLLSRDPFGCGDLLAGISLESHAQFPGLPAVAPGRLGPVYEFRTYVLKIGGLAPTLAAWAPAIPSRTALSPLAILMYALDGPPRFTHVWAYRSFEERLAIRLEAVRSGVWPAAGAPEWLTTSMNSEVYWPTHISKLA